MKTDKIFSETLANQRVFIWFACFNIFLLSLFFKIFLPDSHFPLWMPAGLIVYALTVFFLSYAFKLIAKNIDYVMYPYLYLVSSWFVYLAFMNHFNPNYLLPLVSVILLTGIDSFRKYYDFLYWRIFSFFLALIAAINVSDPQTSPLMFIYIIMSATLFSISTEQVYLKSLKKVKESRNLLFNYFNIAQVLIVVLDTQGRIININNFALFVLGYEQGELEGENWFDKCIPVDIRENLRNAFNIIVEEDPLTLKNIENRVLCKNNEEKVVQWSNSIQKDTHGKVISVLSTGIDVTEERSQQSAFNRKTKELEKLTDMMVGRELKIAELKKKVIELERQNKL